MKSPCDLKLDESDEGISSGNVDANSLFLTLLGHPAPRGLYIKLAAPL